MTRPAGTGCVKNSGFKAVEKGSPTLQREFTNACDWHGKSCLLAPVLISLRLQLNSIEVRKVTICFRWASPTYLVLGRDGRGVRLGSESSSGAGAGGGGVWKFGSSKSGNLRNWTSRDLGSKPSTKLELQNQNPCRPINQGVPSIGKPSSKLQMGSLI